MAVADLAQWRARRGASDEAWVGKPDIAKHFGGVSVRTVERWCAERGMPHRKIGSVVLFRISEAEAWAEAQAAGRL